ncbi:MAG: phosphate ABC transporter permease subunit PstC [Actinomycetota bacterium]
MNQIISHSDGAPDLRGRRRRGEGALEFLLRLCAGVTVLTTFGIVFTLFGETVGFFREVSFGEFFGSTSWAPTFGSNAAFGVWPLINGTLMVAGIGILTAVPLGLLVAVYLSEYAPVRVRRILKPFLEVLAGLPTVVLGFFALHFVTQVVLKRFIPGIETFNALSAGLVVGLMIVPTIASLSEDAMRAVPRGLREAAYGLGAPRRTVALKVVFPAAVSGIVASVVLGLARAIGETMIVAIAAGNQPQLSFDPLKGIQTMTAFIVQVSLGDTPYGSTAYKTIFAVATTLFVMTFTLNAFSNRIANRYRERYE